MNTITFNLTTTAINPKTVARIVEKLTGATNAIVDENHDNTSTVRASITVADSFGYTAELAGRYLTALAALEFTCGVSVSISAR